jgi:Putative adhesin
MPTFETDEPIALSIEISHATVHVIATERTDTVVTVNPSDRENPEDVEAAAKTAVELADGTLLVKGPKLGGIAGRLVGWQRSGSVAVTVELPEGSSLRTDTGFVDLRCDGRLGEVEAKTGAGDVRLDRTGPLRVRTAAGKVTVEEASGSAEIVGSGELMLGNVGGDAEVKNLNGKTWIGRVDGALKVKSANGDVTVDDAGGDVTVKTANGDVRLGQVARGSVSAETASGALTIGIKEGTAAWIDAVTKYGKVRNDLTSVTDPGESPETVEIRGRTAFGDVLIGRS